MIQGIICTDEVAKASNNLLNEFCNFNDVFVWNKSSGGTNATIINNTSGRQSYFGAGSVSLNFTGTSEVAFDTGDTEMQMVVQRTGNYILSYAFDKDDNNADINFTVEVYVNSVLQPNNTITQNLFDSSGFVNEKWNVYFQYLFLEYGDILDFSFKAQSDTNGCILYFYRLKLEIDDKGFGFPTIYTEGPLAIIEEENTITVGKGSLKNISSPRVIDKPLQGLTAGLGKYATDAVDLILDKTGAYKRTEKPAKEFDINLPTGFPKAR